MADVIALNDNKHFNFVFGGKGPLGLKVAQTQETGSVDGVISNFKIYNYCKPNIDNDKPQSFLDAKDIRHPLIEHLQDKEIGAEEGPHAP